MAKIIGIGPGTTNSAMATIQASYKVDEGVIRLAMAKVKMEKK